jgi:hypothetical protein
VAFGVPVTGKLSGLGKNALFAEKEPVNKERKNAKINYCC